ncbi:hypothetical protein TNCV_4722261 [Trichonephila clavipes]|uniref:Uncharacterized protein n=1 Tax=Trichonephila clavipes TaxID=2585209 RepID=A0A8X6W6E0_TRICX|nr:hypothetical protein TNCV_4722261 [Trichonephila clavipes]
MAKKSSVLRQERKQTEGGEVPKEAELTDFEMRFLVEPILTLPLSTPFDSDSTDIEISTMLAKNFKKYFLDEDNLEASYEWINHLFQDTPEGLSTSEEEIFIDFTSSEKLKGNFVINRSLNFG